MTNEITVDYQLLSKQRNKLVWLKSQFTRTEILEGLIDLIITIEQERPFKEAHDIVVNP